MIFTPYSHTPELPQLRVSHASLGFITKAEFITINSLRKALARKNKCLHAIRVATEAHSHTHVSSTRESHPKSCFLNAPRNLLDTRIRMPMKTADPRA